MQLPGVTQRDTNGETILHLQYILLVSVDVVFGPFVVVVTLPIEVLPELKQSATPWIDTLSQVAVQYGLLKNLSTAVDWVLQVAVVGNFTHLVDANKGVVKNNIEKIVRMLFFILLFLVCFFNLSCCKKLHS